MRLVTYDRAGARHLGAWVGDRLVDLPAAVGHPAFPATLEGLVTRSRGSALEAARAALGNPEYVANAWVAPIPRVLAPLSLPDAGRGRSVAPDAVVSWLEGTPCEWQPEIACVIGRVGRDVTPEEARALVFGFLLASTWTLPADEDEPTPTATALGPCLVTIDDFDLTDVTLTTRVNKGVWAQERIGDPLSRFAGTIARTSNEREVLPGEVFSCSPFDAPGPGGGRRVLSRDATVEIEAGPLGVLRNRVRFRRSSRG
jgi:hypothetical protein